MCKPDWKRKAQELQQELDQEQALRGDLEIELDSLEKSLISPTPARTIDLYVASSLLLDKLEEIGDDKAEIYLPDKEIKIYNKADVESAYSLEEVSSITYIAEEHDCDDFAAKLYGKFAGLVWTNVHALNWFFDEHSTFWWIEPQNKKISRTLEAWQGSEVRFYIGR